MEQPATGPPPRGAADAVSRGFHDARWRRHKRLAFGLGSLVGFVAGNANATWGLALGFPLLGSGDLFFAALAVGVAPVVEESAKLLPLLMLRSEEGAVYPAHRWLVLGALSGLGFTVLEALTYTLSLLPLSPGLAGYNLVFRLLFPLHALTTCVAGYAYGRYRATRNGWLLAGGLLLAMAMHMAWNLWQVLGGTGVGS